MTSGFTDALAAKVFESVSGSYLALHTDNPGVSEYASELFGGGYTRQSFVFTEPIAKTVRNAQTITFSGLPATSVTYLGWWDAAVRGSMLMWVQVSPRILVAAGTSLPFEPNSIAVSLF